MKDLSLFFSELDNEPYRMIFAEAERIWDPLKNIDYILQSLIQNIFIKGSFSLFRPNWKGNFCTKMGKA